MDRPNDDDNQAIRNRRRDNDNDEEEEVTKEDANPRRGEAGANHPQNGDDGVDHDPRGSDGPPDEDDGANRNSVVVVSPHLYRGLGLGPMVRASTTPLRMLALQRGANWCYTEELVDRSLIGLNRVERTLPSGVQAVDFEKPLDQVKRGKKRAHQASAASNTNNHQKYHPGGSEWPGPPVLLRIDPNREAGRLVCQLGTSDPDLALQAALVVHRDVAAIDINMGCPKKFSTLGGMGASLLRDPDRACRIVRHLTSHLPNRVPVSAKIRLLVNDDHEPLAHATVDFCRGLIQAGASALAIHGRTVHDRETCDSRRDALTDVLSAVTSEFPHIPVCANGDFYTRDEAMEFLRHTGASGILLSRPALYDINLFGGAVLPPVSGGDGFKSSASSSSSSVVAEYRPPGSGGGEGHDNDDARAASIRDYLKLAVRYDASSANAKYVVSEMLHWRRRTPANRVVSMTEPIHVTSTSSRRPSLTETCACKSLAELCHLWGVDPTAAATTLPSVVSSTSTSGSCASVSSSSLSPGASR